MGSLSALLTAFYSSRLIYLTFIANTNSKKQIIFWVQESPRVVMVPLLILAFGSVFVGYIGKELALSYVVSPIIPNFTKVLPLLLSLVGGGVAFIVYFTKPLTMLRVKKRFNGIRNSTEFGNIVYTFLNSA